MKTAICVRCDRRWQIVKRHAKCALEKESLPTLHEGGAAHSTRHGIGIIICCTTLAFTNSSADTPLATLSKAPDVLKTGGGSVIDKGMMGVLVGGRLDATVQQLPNIHRFLVDAVDEG